MTLLCIIDANNDTHLLENSTKNRRPRCSGLWSFGEDDDSDVFALSLADPSQYVLKPQREGGGKNLYDDELTRALSTGSYEERGAYVLMQNIRPQ